MLSPPLASTPANRIGSRPDGGKSAWHQLASRYHETQHSAVAGLLSSVASHVMSITAEAVYENGTLKFHQALPLAEQEQVRVTIESKGDGTNKLQSGLNALRQLCDEEPIHASGSRFTREELHERR